LARNVLTHPFIEIVFETGVFKNKSLTVMFNLIFENLFQI